MKLRYKTQILEDQQGKKTGIILHLKDFEKIIELIEDLQDEQAVYERMHEKSVPYEKVKNKFLGNVTKK